MVYFVKLANVCECVQMCENIAQYFANKYENLYNSVEDSNDLLFVEESISQRIKNTDICEVLKITPMLIKEALKKIKPDKSDPISEIFSDYPINAP